MREQRTICLACRSRLLVNALSRQRPRWSLPVTSKIAARYSTSSTIAPTPDAADFERAFHQQDTDVAPPRPPARAAKSRVEGRSSILSATSSKSRPPRQHDRPDALAMFQNIAQERGAHSGLPSPAQSLGSNLYQDLAKVQAMSKKEDAQTCYEFFSTRILPNAVVKGRIAPIVKENAARIMGRVTSAKQKDFENKQLPSLTQITRDLRNLGLVAPQRWASLVLALVQHLCSVSTSPDAYSAIEDYEGALARREILLQDLVTTWKAFSLVGISHMVRQDNATEEEFRFPRSIDRNRLAECARQGDVHSAMARLFPQFALTQLQGVTVAALGTFVLLTDETKTNPSVRRSARSFLSRLARILAAVPVDHDNLHLMFQPYPELRQYVLKRWPEVLQDLKTQKEGLSDGMVNRRPGFLDASQDKKIGSVHKQIGQALRMRNLPILEQAWLNFWGSAQTDRPTESKMKEIRENPLLFDYFLMAFMALRRQDRVEQILKCMSLVNVKPAVNTWTSMMEGCKRARDAIGVETVWNQLLKTGKTLDTACWTARISGLIESGQPEAGIRALNEMARRWKYAEQNGTTARAVKPSIEPVNAAMTGLLRLNATAAAQKVLAWASLHDIEPDVITYNILLRPMIRQGLTEEVNKTFMMMKHQGIQADVATFTIVLDGSLSQIGEQSAEKQRETVTRVLSEMEAAGVEANMETYGKMMYLLLREGDKARDSVKAVLAHIWGKGLELSSHIYTILVEHYFSRDPPDLDAVRDLIQSRGLVNKSSTTDHVFWERVIKGYAQAGDTTSALDIFERIDSFGAAVTLSTLEVLLRALVHFHEPDKAQKLVDTVLSHRDRFMSESAGNTSSRFWRHGFWGFAMDNGFVREALLKETAE